MKEVKIDVPEGYEIDPENSTFECIKFKKKSLPSYDEIQNLARGGSPYRSGVYCCLRHVEQLKVYRMLLEVAEYLNKGWEPDWKDYSQSKYVIYKSNILEDDYRIGLRGSMDYGMPCFKTIELAEQAIKIIGKKNLDLLFN